MSPKMGVMLIMYSVPFFPKKKRFHVTYSKKVVKYSFLLKNTMSYVQLSCQIICNDYNNEKHFFVSI